MEKTVGQAHSQNNGAARDDLFQGVKAALDARPGAMTKQLARDLGVAKMVSVHIFARRI